MRRGAAFGLTRMLGPFVARERADHDIDGASIELGLKIRVTVSGDVGEEFFNNLEPDVGVLHFAAAELERDFDFHVLTEEPNGMIDFNAEVVRVDFRTKLDLFDLGGVLVLFGFLVALSLFVAKLAVIDQPTDRWGGVGSDLDQVNAIGARHGERVAEGQDAELLAVDANDPDFAGTNFPVNPDERSGRRRGT